MSKATPISSIGDGYSTFRGSALATVLDFEEQDGGPAKINTLIKVCMTTDDVYDALSLTASVDMSTSWGSFSDRLSFAHSITQNTRTVNILVVANKTIKTSRVTSQKFLRKFKDATTLYQQAGDSFVSYIAWGGYYMASYSFVAHDESSYTKLVNSASANISSGVTSFSGDISIALTHITSDSSVNWTYLQEGIGFSQGQLPNQDHMTDFVLNFGNLNLDHPAIVDFATSSYDVVPDCPKFQQIDSYRQAYLGGFASGGGYAAIEAAAKANLPIIQSVYDMYNRYGVLSLDPKINSHITSLQAVIQSIDQWRQSVDSNPTGKISPPNVNAPLDLPSPVFLIENGMLAGPVQNGTMFADVQLSWVAQGIIPKTLSVTYSPAEKGEYISSFTRSYQDATNVDITNFPQTIGTSGDPSLAPPVWLTQANHVQEITVYFTVDPDERFIWGIQLKTSQQGTVTLNSTILSRNYLTTLNWDTITIPANSFFLGWNAVLSTDGGRSRPVALQPVYVSFQQPTWNGPSGGANIVSKLAKPPTGN